MPRDKKAQRGEIRGILKNVPKEEFCLQGESAAAKLRVPPVWSRYKTLLIFLSMDSEISTRPLLCSALDEGKRVFAPAVRKGPDAAETLVFFPVLSPDGPWRYGPFGIREPLVPVPGDGGGGAAGAADFPALIVTPGLAFGRDFTRLGRGGGYYDRFFAELDRAGRDYFALGLCMDFQLLETVPAGEHDKKMDGLLTGRELLNRVAR